MKLDSRFKYGAIALVILLIGTGVALTSMKGEGDVSNLSRSELKEGKSPRQRQANRRTGRKGKVARNGRTSAKDIKLEAREKPNMFLDDEEEKELTDLARKVLSSLQMALDTDDYQQIKHILDMTRHAAKGSLSKATEGMPVALRRKLVEAIGWFGAQGLPEMLEFIADENEEVSQMALDQFEQALCDVSLGDRDRARIVSLASTVLTDADALEQIFMEISNMRNSVAVNTIYTICQDGTPKAKELIIDTMEFVTGEDNIKTTDDLARWLEENPDGPDDEDLYGPMETE